MESTFNAYYKLSISDNILALIKIVFFFVYYEIYFNYKDLLMAYKAI